MIWGKVIVCVISVASFAFIKSKVYVTVVAIHPAVNPTLNSQKYVAVYVNVIKQP